MNKNNDIILIKNTHLEHIDKIIVILNENSKNTPPKDLIIKQAENIIFEYVNKNSKKPKTLSLLITSSVCFLFGTALLFSIKLFL